MQQALRSRILVRQLDLGQSLGTVLLTHISLRRRHLLHFLILAMAFAAAAASTLR